MALDTLPASLSFLTDASHLLATTSPEISAHLMTQRNSFMFHHDLQQSEMQRQHVCGCCGHIMIPGRGSTLKLETSKTLRKKKTTTQSQSSKRGKNIEQPEMNSTSRPETETPHKTRKRIECGKCGRVTSMAIPPSPPISRGRQKLAAKRRLTSPTAETQTQNKHRKLVSSMDPGLPGNATSRDGKADTKTAAPVEQPAKPSSSANASSKKRAKSRKQGLQALLQQSQSANSTAQGGLGLSLSDFLKK